LVAFRGTTDAPIASSHPCDVKRRAPTRLPGVRLKDLRDTFASHLLTRGVTIQFVSRQLGHGGVSVTEQHYAKYLGAGGDDFVYLEPGRLAPGEIPVDLLARLDAGSHPTHSGDVFAVPRDLGEDENVSDSAGLECGYDLRGPLAQLVEHRTFNPGVQGSSP